MELAQYIMSIFRTAPMTIFSWGFNTPIAIKNGLRFRVNGLRYKGIVEIEYNQGDDLFIVRLIKNGNILKEKDGIYVDMLIDCVDGMVEKTEEYKKDVERWLCEVF